jgi:hypothetical protein
MAVTHSTAMRNDFCTAVKTRIDNTGSSYPGGAVRFKDAGSSVLATCRWPGASFGTPSNGQMASNALDKDLAPTVGTIANGEIVDRANTQVVGFSVGTSGADANLSKLAIVSGDYVEVTSLTYIAPV